MTIVKGLCYPIGTRVRVTGHTREMLVVDMNPTRSHLIAAWKDGDAVSEDRFSTAELEAV